MVGPARSPSAPAVDFAEEAVADPHAGDQIALAVFLGLVVRAVEVDSWGMMVVEVELLVVVVGRKVDMEDMRLVVVGDVEREARQVRSRA